jgi:hypothetical protein
MLLLFFFKYAKQTCFIAKLLVYIFVFCGNSDVSSSSSADARLAFLSSLSHYLFFARTNEEDEGVVAGALTVVVVLVHSVSSVCGQHWSRREVGLSLARFVVFD